MDIECPFAPHQLHMTVSSGRLIDATFVSGGDEDSSLFKSFCTFCRISDFSSWSASPNSSACFAAIRAVMKVLGSFKVTYRRIYEGRPFMKRALLC